MAERRASASMRAIGVTWDDVDEFERWYKSQQENTMDPVKLDETVTKSKPDYLKPAEPRRPKPTADQIHNALYASVKAMVLEADGDGRRDRPSVVAAREALALCEPEPEPVKPAVVVAKPLVDETRPYSSDPFKPTETAKPPVV